MHLVAVAYSTNLDYAFKDIQTKFSFLIFPLLFTFFKPWPAHFDNLKKSFIAGCVIALVLCLVKALMDYSKSQDTNLFFYTTFSRLMHPTYFGFYLNLALIFLIDDAYSGKEFSKLSSKIEFFLTELFLFSGIFLLSARMALLVTIATIFLLVIIKSIQQKDKRNLSLALMVSFLVAAGIQYELNGLYNRFTQIENAVQSENQITTEIAENTTKPEEYNSTTSRLALWKYAMELITSSPATFVFGVGTGDIKEELREVYKKHKFQKGIDENYNPHNQFLHTGVVIGIVGIALLFLILILPFIKSVSKSYWPLVMFLLIILLNGLTESILEVQREIIFFCLFYCLLISELNLKIKTETKK